MHHSPSYNQLPTVDISNNKAVTFCRKHPIIFNIALIMLCALAVMWAALTWLDSWTAHGKYEIVPDVKGMSYARAAEILRSSGLTVELNDSLYSDKCAPGDVIEQMPRANDKVKPQRTVYLTVNAFSPKNVIIPAIAGLSLRQAKSELESRGIRNIQVTYVPSEYKDLTLGVKFNGLSLRSGSKVPVSATLTLEVGEGNAEQSDDSLPVNDDPAITTDDEPAFLE